MVPVRSRSEIANESTGRPGRRLVLQGGAALAAGLPILGVSACGDLRRGDDDVLIRISDVPVGGGRIVLPQRIAVTQPRPGIYRAFSAVCTHLGCLLTAVRDGGIECACHRSRFSIADGTVQGGPAPFPLLRLEIRVEGDMVVLA